MTSDPWADPDFVRDEMEAEGRQRKPAAPPVLWRAGDDQVAHAFYHRQPRTLCGRPVTPERLAWPTANVCPRCRDAASEATA